MSTVMRAAGRKGAPLFARVVVNLPELPADRLYDYLLPEELGVTALPGARVLVPFGGRKAEAVLWEITPESAYGEREDLRPVLAVLDEEPLLSGFQLSLIDWMARRFFCRRCDLLRLFFPPGVKIKTEKCWQRLVPVEAIAAFLATLPLPEETCRPFLEKVAGAGSLTPLPDLAKEEAQLLDLLVQAGYVKTGWFPEKPATKFKTVKCYSLTRVVPLPPGNEESCKLTEKQKAVYRYLQEEAGRPVPAEEILAATGVSTFVLRALVEKGVVECSLQQVARDPFSCFPVEEEPAPAHLQLNPDQAAALARILHAIDRPAPAGFLLEGVTGSGKTEIYLRVIEEVLKRGKNAFYLVPEIALTPQTVARVRTRFGGAVAVFHSGLGQGERFDEWWRVKRGQVRVVVGARSALFLPLPNPGLIILDEEHEYTYKQEETPRYHAREVAREICRRTSGLLLLGSATPSLESYRAAETGTLTRVTLPRRVLGRPLPEIVLVDLREEFKARRFAILSPVLREAIASCLEQKEQVILLLNRRGYATFIICRECGHVLRCPACDVTLTYHRRPNLLLCHYCGFRRKPPETCPQCRSHNIRYVGRGTQRLEEELNQVYPGARIVRMDLDTTGRKGSHERIYQDLCKGKIDILVGTQMVAKGFDLPNVTLVGIINADVALNLPDFRAAERTYQLLTQAAGRAGRGEKPGLVVVQTFNPGHYSIAALRQNDAEEFYRRELLYREAGRYPPFTGLIRLVFSGADPKAVMATARDLTAAIKEAVKEKITGGVPAQGGREESEESEEIIGPQPAVITKVQNRYRWHTLVKTANLDFYASFLPQLIAEHQRKSRQKVRIIVDENPYSML
jgi:primosomal protein N' (replication factor Y)